MDEKTQLRNEGDEEEKHLSERSERGHGEKNKVW